jgi:inorganic triphosphatase YgiF
LEIEPQGMRRVTGYLKSITARDPRKHTLLSVYFDTPDLAFHRGGVSLCVRSFDGRHIQTISHSSQATGLLDCEEWERRIRGPQPDLAAARRTALEPLMNPQSREAVRPVFEARVRRSLYRAEWGGLQVTAILDLGVANAGKRRAPVAELDLQVVRGDLGRLFGLAKALDEVTPVRLNIKSDAERAYALVRKGVNAVETAANVKLSRSLSTAEAFQIIARGCLRQLLANEIAMLSGNGEALHQMRVAVRRLRATMSVFSEIVSDRQSQRLKGELRWIAATLGPARDLDVFLIEVLIPLRHQHGKEPGVAALCREFEGRRVQAHEEAGAAVRSRRFRILALDTLGWIEAGPWVMSQDEFVRLRREQSIAFHATEELARRRRQLRRRGKTLQQLSAAERHRLRIRAKKLRYATEFFAELFTQRKQAKRCKAALSALQDLQGALGALNDIATRESLASHVAAAKPRASATASGAEKAFAAGMIFAAEEAHIAQLLDAAERSYTSFLAVKPFAK